MSITGTGATVITVTGGITGSGAANQVTLWDSASTITGDAGFTWSGTGATFDAVLGRNLTIGGLTTGRATLTGTAGLQKTDAGLAYSGSGATFDLTIGRNLTITGLTAGDVTLTSTAGLQVTDSGFTWTGTGATMAVAIGAKLTVPEVDFDSHRSDYVQGNNLYTYADAGRIVLWSDGGLGIDFDVNGAVWSIDNDGNFYPSAGTLDFGSIGFPISTTYTTNIKASSATLTAVHGLSLTQYANNAAALIGGLVAGDLYTETGTDPLRVAVVF